MKKFLLIIVWLSSICLGDYIPDDLKTVSCGLSGQGLGSGLFNAGLTYIDKSYPVKTSGTMTCFKGTFQSSSGLNSTKVVLFQIRGNAIINFLNITAHINAARQLAGSNVFTYDTSADYNGVALNLSDANFQLISGDYLGMYIKDNISSYCADNSVNGLVSYSGEYNGTGVLSDVAGTYSMCWDAYISTSARILLDDNTFHRNSAIIGLPAYIDTKQYIIIEDANVPAGEDLQFKFKYNINGIEHTSFTINLSFDGNGPDNGYLTIYAGDTFSNTFNYSIAGQKNNNFNLYIYYDSAQGDIMLTFLNTLNGQGGKGAWDSRFTTIPNRATVRYNFPVNRIDIVNGGGNALARRIVVCREPVLMLSDSFGSKKNEYYYPVTLSNVGVYLGQAFTEKRYVINGGITGNCVNYTGSSTRLIERWNRPENRQDLCAMRSAVIVLVNGPGLNDIARLAIPGDNNTNALASSIAGSLMRIVGEAFLDNQHFGFKNDIVMCNLIPYLAGNQAEQETVVMLNKFIKKVAVMQQVPMANVYDDFNTTDWYSDTGTHPNQAGSTFIADKIARAYENNLVDDCSGSVLSDLNDDCLVDIEDFVIMASEWLECKKVPADLCW